MAVWKPDFGEYDYVWDFICGVTAGNPWPTGNEDDLWDLAAEWAAVSQALGDAMQDAGPVVNELIAAWGGDSGYAFLGFWEKLGQSPEAGLGAVADMARALSDMSDNAALELQYNKLTTLITVLITIISVFTALVAAFFTGGGSAGAIQPIMMGGRVAVQQSFRQLVRNIARKVVEKELRKELLKKLVTKEALKKLGKEAVEELVEEVLEEVVLVDGLTQAYQMATGRRTHWDGSKTAASAIGATAGVPIGMGVAPAAQWAKNRAKRLVTARLTDATIDRINHGIQRVNSPGTHLGGLRKQFAGTPGQAVSIGLVNAVTSPTSSWIANGVIYGNWEYPTDSILSSAFAGASRANTISPPQLAAVTVTHGTTGFRETLLGSHPAALDLGVPTTLQPGPPLAESIGTGTATVLDVSSGASSHTTAGTSAVAAPPGAADHNGASPSVHATDIAPAPSPITAALAPVLSGDAMAPPRFTRDPTALPLLVSGSTPSASTATATAAAVSVSLKDGTQVPGSPNRLTPTAPTLADSTGASLMERQNSGSSGVPQTASATPSVTSSEAPQTVVGSPSSVLRPSLDTRPAAGFHAGPTDGNGGTAGFNAQLSDQSSARNDLVHGPTRSAARPKAPAAPSGQKSADQVPEPPLQRAVPPPIATSDGVTATATFSYRLENRAFDPSSDLTEPALAMARDLAVVVQQEAVDQRWDKDAQEEFFPSVSAALILPDGVIRAHTSMKTRRDGPEPNRHRLVQEVIDQIEEQDAERKAALASGDGSADQPKIKSTPWSGYCAEVALVSDFLHEFERSYSGPGSSLLEAVRTALAGSKIVPVQALSVSPRGFGAVRKPCPTCTEMLKTFGIEVIPKTKENRPPSELQRVWRGPAEAPPASPGGGRPIGESGGLDQPDPLDQRALEDSVPRDRYGRPVRFPDPLGRWLGLVNDGGPAATAFRANNCLDTSLSLLGTWHGNPQVSAPRRAEYTSDNKPSTAGETDGRQRAEETLGATFDYHGNTADTAFPELADQLLAAGHGASAILITSIDPGHGGGSHAWNAVNYNGIIHWIDAQIGVVSSRPLFDYAVDGVWSIALGPDGRPLRASDPPAVAPGLASIEEEGAPAAQTVPTSSFVPEGRGSHLPDLVQGELLAAAAGVRPEDFASKQVVGVDVGDAVTVRLADGRSVRFEGAVGSGMRELATTAVGRNRNVVTVNARVAPEQLTRVWVHEIAAALQEKRPVGFFRRLVERVGRTSGMNALVEARLSERRYLIRSMSGADRASYQALARELGDLDRYLSDVGVSVRRLPRPPDLLNMQSGDAASNAHWLVIPTPHTPSGSDVGASMPDPQPGTPGAHATPAEMVVPASALDLARVGVRRATENDLWESDTPIPESLSKMIRDLQIRMVPVSDLAFTQRSIGKMMGDGTTEIAAFVDRLKSGWMGEPLHGVLWGDGTLVSIDNRRLFAAKRAGRSMVPFLAHSPSEQLDWPPGRLKKGALQTDIRELPDGTWQIGKGEGKIVHRIGDRPKNYGQAAIFRAVNNRDLLAVRFFGSMSPPVTVKNPKMLSIKFSTAELRELGEFDSRVRESISALEPDIVEIRREARAVVGAEHPSARPIVAVASRDEIGRSFLPRKRLENLTIQDFVHDMDNAFTVSLVLPPGPSFRTALDVYIRLFQERGYHLETSENRWLPGNSEFGFRTTWTTPSNDPRFRVEFLTNRAAELAGRPEVQELRRIIREPKEEPVRKIHAKIRLIQAGGVSNMWADAGPLAATELLAQSWIDGDSGLAAFAADHPKLFRDYLTWLQAEGLQLPDVALDYGLQVDDLPIRNDVREKLARDDSDLLHALQETSRRVSTGRHRDTGLQDDRRAGLGSPGNSLGIRPFSSPRSDLRSGEFERLQGSGADRGRGDDAGDHRWGTAAGRGDDSLALPVEGPAAGARPAVDSPPDPAGVGPFAREEPPLPLDLTRGYGKHRLVWLEDSAYQSVVDKELATPEGPAIGADPRSHPYGGLINDGGPEKPGRDINCVDCSLAALSSFYGRPEVSRARWADGTTIGEWRGLERAVRWLGADSWLYYEDLPTIADEFWAVHDHVAALGPGSAALVVNVWQAFDDAGPLFDDENQPVHGDSHATVVVYPLDADGPVWWDPQAGTVSDGPPADMVSDTVDLSYITVELDGRVNGDGAVGYEGSGTGIPGARVPARRAVAHAAVFTWLDAAVDSGDSTGNRTGPATRESDTGIGGKHRPDNVARTISAFDRYQEVSNGGGGGSGSRGSATLPGATPAGPIGERGALGADSAGRVDGDLLLSGPLWRLGRAALGGHGADERPTRSSIDQPDAFATGMGGRFGELPGPGPVPVDTPAGQPPGSGDAPPGTHRDDASERGGVPGALSHQVDRAPAGPFAREDPAPPLATTRQFGEGNLRPLELESYQDDVKQTLATPDGYAVGADPRQSRFGVVINDGGIEQPQRNNNCLDCSLAALSSFYGRPEVAVPRSADGSSDGEIDGVERAMQWLGADTWLHHDGLPTMAEQFWALHDEVAALGPGTAALVVNIWQDEDADGPLFDEFGWPVHGDSHATVVVYPIGSDGPVWWDPQEGLTADGPPEWLASGTVELSYITVEIDGRVNGGGSVGDARSGTGLPGSRHQARHEMEHAQVPVRLDAAVNSGHAGGDQARAAAGQSNLGPQHQHRTHHIARALSPQPDHSAVLDGNRGRQGSRGSADLSRTPVAGPEAERRTAGAHAAGRVDEAVLLRAGIVGHDGVRDDYSERAERTPINSLGSGQPAVEMQRHRVPGSGQIRGTISSYRPLRSKSDSPSTPRRQPPLGGGTDPALRGDLTPERDHAIRQALTAHNLTHPQNAADIAAAYDVAHKWTAPYLVAAVDRLLRQLDRDARFLFVTTDDTVPWIVGRLAPDFARHHALWVQWPPTPNGWRHLQAQPPASLVTDDPANLPTARPLLPTTPATPLVSRLHGPMPDSGAITAAQRMVARAAVASVVRAAMNAGPEAGRTAVYAAATQLDRQASATEAPDPLLVPWLASKPKS